MTDLEPVDPWLNPSRIAERKALAEWWVAEIKARLRGETLSEPTTEGDR